MAKISTIDEAYNFSIAMKANGWNNLDTVSRLKEHLGPYVNFSASEDGTMVIFYFPGEMIIFLPHGEIVRWVGQKTPKEEG